MQFLFFDYPIGLSIATNPKQNQIEWILLSKYSIFSRTDSSEVWLWFCMLGVCSSSLTKARNVFFTFFCQTLVFLIIWGSIPGQKWHFFRSLPQPWDLPFRIGFKKLYMQYKGQVPESALTRFKIDLYILLFSKNFEILSFFKTPSFKIKNISGGCQYHIWYGTATIKTLPELCRYRQKISACVFQL